MASDEYACFGGTNITEMSQENRKWLAKKSVIFIARNKQISFLITNMQGYYLHLKQCFVTMIFSNNCDTKKSLCLVTMR